MKNINESEVAKMVNIYRSKINYFIAIHSFKRMI